MVRVMANSYAALTKWQDLFRDLQTLIHLILILTRSLKYNHFINVKIDERLSNVP